MNEVRSQCMKNVSALSNVHDIMTCLHEDIMVA